MTKHIQSVFNFLGAKLTTAAIDAKLSMTTSEHKHVGICRWCGSYIAYKNHEFVNLCAVYFQVGPKELKTCASGSYLNAKALHLPSSPSSPRSDKSSISISCANSTTARWTKNYNTKGENEHPQSFSTPHDSDLQGLCHPRTSQPVGAQLGWYQWCPVFFYADLPSEKLASQLNFWSFSARLKCWGHSQLTVTVCSVCFYMLFSCPRII